MIFSLLAGALFSSGEGLDGEFPVAPNVEGTVKVGAKFDTKTEALKVSSQHRCNPHFLLRLIHFKS